MEIRFDKAAVKFLKGLPHVLFTGIRKKGKWKYLLSWR